MKSVEKSGVDSRLAGGRLTINLDALVANYQALKRMSGKARCSAVVKADAYGLGADKVVGALWSVGCDTYFVALPQEGFAIKRKYPSATVYVLNGLHEQSIDSIAEGNLVPVLSSIGQIELWAGYWQKRGSRRPCAIQVDTGMNRLGLSVDEAIAFRARNIKEHLVTPMLIMSHLACADEPSHPLNAKQLASFQKVASVFDDVDSSLANSSAIQSGDDYLFDLTRPGIALYGGESIEDVVNPMQPVITLEARIVQIKDVPKGATISYGATQTLQRDSRIATVSVGYADGYPRAGSGAGVALRQAVERPALGSIQGHKVPLLGRMTMDLSMFDVTDIPDEALAHGWIELIGRDILLDDAARAAGTIGYELLTSLGHRYERIYVSNG